MSRRWAVGCVMTLVLLALVSSVAVGPDPVEGREAGASIAPLTAGAQVDFERAQFRIRIAEDGNATWTFIYYRMLDDEEQREQFEAFAERFRTEETPLYEDFQQQADALAGAGANYTEREMKATDFSRDAYVDRTPFAQDADIGQSFGEDLAVVELSFTWTGFGRVEDERLYVGDVFGRGLYLADGESLVLEVEEGLQFESVAPDEGAHSGATLAESHSVTWTGELDFPDGHPRAVIGAATRGDRSPNDTSPGVADGDGATRSEDDGTPTTLGWPWLAIGGLLLLVVVSLAAVVRRNGQLRSQSSETQTTIDSTATQTEPDVGEDSEDAALDDEERVALLLERNGGRMRQSEIVAETPWSKSKVSMLLSAMEEQGLVSKIQVGRENIVALQGAEPDAVGSPTEDEADDR